MVNTIDATARRRHLAEAVWRLVRRDGLAAASVRSVAAESGLSTGSVRHFFGTQQELITFAMRELLDTVGERVRALADVVDDPDVVERGVRILAEMMPLTDESHDEAFAFFLFVQQARFTPGLEPIATESFTLIHGVCRRVIISLREAGLIADATSPDAHARVLWAAVDGLSVQLLYAPTLVSRRQARLTLRHVLEGMCTS